MIRSREFYSRRWRAMKLCKVGNAIIWFRPKGDHCGSNMKKRYKKVKSENFSPNESWGWLRVGDDRRYKDVDRFRTMWNLNQQVLCRDWWGKILLWELRKNWGWCLDFWYEKKTNIQEADRRWGIGSQRSIIITPFEENIFELSIYFGILEFGVYLKLRD